MEVVERRDRLTFVAETTTMVVIGIILGAFGIGFFCWLLFTLAVYAPPSSQVYQPASPPFTLAPV